MFGPSAICYLFLGGVGGATCAVACTLGLLVPTDVMRRGIAFRAYQGFFSASYVLCLAALALGGLCLLSDGINFHALQHLFFSPRLTYLSVGTYLLLAGMVLSAAFVVFWASGAEKVRKLLVPLRAFQAIGLLLGLGIVVYTGLFLGSMKSVPLWHSAWLTPLFLFSSLSCGLVATLGCMAVQGLSAAFASFMKRLARADAAVIVLEAACLTGFLLDALCAGGQNATSFAAWTSAQSLLAGAEAWMFWLGAVALGMGAPLFLDVLFLRGAHHQGSPYLSVIPCVCVLAGALAMRACIILAGSHPVVYW